MTLGQVKKAFPEGGLISPKLLFERGFLSSKRVPVKIVGSAVLEKPYALHSILVSASVQKAVLAAGGKVHPVK